MLQRIAYTILGIVIALLFIPRLVKDESVQNQVSFLGVSTGSHSTSPELASNTHPPDLSARAAFAYDFSSGAILFTYNFDEKFPIASLTKLMTALVTIKNFNVEEVVTVKRSDANVVGNSMGLVTNEKIAIKSLLYGILVSSSNDAALALASHAGGYEKFTLMMNQEAERLNLYSTKFSNPVGWDYGDNYSTVHDLSVIVNEFLKYEALSQIVKIKDIELASVDKKYTHKLTTTNKLLTENSSVTGIKTGFTSQAKGNLILRVEGNGRTVISIILGSDDREGDSTKLLDWINKVYKW